MQGNLEFKLKLNAKDGLLEIEDLAGKIHKIGDVAKIAEGRVQTSFNKIATFGSNVVFGINNIMQATQKLISFTSKPLQSAMKFENMTTRLD
jgi:hypothetical protein